MIDQLKEILQNDLAFHELMKERINVPDHLRGIHRGRYFATKKILADIARLDEAAKISELEYKTRNLLLSMAPGDYLTIQDRAVFRHHTREAWDVENGARNLIIEETLRELHVKL